MILTLAILGGILTGGFAHWLWTLVEDYRALKIAPLVYDVKPREHVSGFFDGRTGKMIGNGNFTVEGTFEPMAENPKVWHGGRLIFNQDFKGVVVPDTMPEEIR